LFAAVSRSCSAFLTPSVPTWVAFSVRRALAAVWYWAAAEQSSADNGAAEVGAGVEAAGGGAVALWLAHPARTTQPSAAATNRVEVAFRQTSSVIPTVLGMTLLHELPEMGSATPLAVAGMICIGNGVDLTSMW
jgi:hypothetical protein